MKKYRISVLLTLFHLSIDTPSRFNKVETDLVIVRIICH